MKLRRFRFCVRIRIMTEDETSMLIDALDYLGYVAHQVKERLPSCGLTDAELKSEVFQTFSDLLRWYKPQTKDGRTPQGFRTFCRQFGAKRTINRLMCQMEKERRIRDLANRIKEQIEADEKGGIVRHKYGYWDAPIVESAGEMLEKRDFWHHVLGVCDAVDLQILRLMIEHFIRNGEGNRKSNYCNFTEIGRKLGVSGNAVKKRMKKLAEKLRCQIGESEYADCCAA